MKIFVCNVSKNIFFRNFHRTNVKYNILRKPKYDEIAAWQMSDETLFWEWIYSAPFFLPFPRINPRRASRTKNRPDNASSFHGLEFSTIQPKAPFVGIQLLSSHDVYGQAGPPARANQPETHVSTFARPYPRSVGGCETSANIESRRPRNAPKNVILLKIQFYREKKYRWGIFKLDASWLCYQTC